MVVRTFAARQRPLKFMLLCAGAAALSACASTGGGDKKYSEAIGAFTSPAADTSQLDPIAAAAFWGTRYNRDQKDAAVAVKYSAALRKIGSVDEAVTVISRAAEQNVGNPDVSLEAGKTLIEANRAFEAVRYLEEATAAKPDDWTAFSAYGVALDNIGEHELAQAQYDRALAIAPGAVNVLNNKALSFALSGDLSRAATALRAAASARGSDARVRQNLALVLALKGDMDEAERLARSDLPPQVANQNIAYFRSLMNQPAYWAEYAPENFDAPVFEPAPEQPAAREPSVTPTPLPLLREEKQPEEKQEKGAPIAMEEVTPVTNTAVQLREETPDTSPEMSVGDAVSDAAQQVEEPVQLAPAAELKP